MFPIPKQIKNGFFTIGERIGKGSFGDVYNAEMNDGKKIAIKFEAKNAKKKCLEEEIEVMKKCRVKCS